MFNLTRDEEVVLIHLGLKTLIAQIAEAKEVKPKIKKVKASKPAVKRSKMSAEGRKRISDMMKKRWKQARKENRNSL